MAPSGDAVSGRSFWPCSVRPCYGAGRVAGIIALSWRGLTRIGEALSATRAQLVLPPDVERSADFILLQINEPKARFRAARHQVAQVDQP